MGDDELMEEIRAVSRQHAVYAMCDGSAIIVQNCVTKLFGEIYKIHHRTMEGVPT